MGKEIYNFEKTGVFRDVVNIELFNTIISFVLNASHADLESASANRILQHIWYEKMDPEKLQTDYGIRYLGELLERYDERVSATAQNMRATISALALLHSIAPESMFVGRQKQNFIRRAKAQADGDFYITCALAIVDGHPGDIALLHKFLEKADTSEKLVFLLSMTIDKETVFEPALPVINILFGTGRTLDPLCNSGIYAWLIRQFYPMVDKRRKKDAAIMKAFCKLPTINAKPDNGVYQLMKGEGYSHEEIVYLNFTLIIDRPRPQSLYSDSITVEKIAMEFVKVYLNSNKTFSDDTYKLILSVINFYKEFYIKINGYKGILDAISNEFRICNPVTFKWMSEMYAGRWFMTFDIMDKDWDVLYELLGTEKYLEAFDSLISMSKKVKLDAAFVRYKEVTGSSFLSSFEDYNGSRHSEFLLLMRSGHITFNDGFITEIIDGNLKNLKEGIGKHVKNYCINMKHKHSFLFWKHIYDNYGIQALNDTIEMRDICDYYQKLNIDLKFLSKSQQRELIHWADDYVFTAKISSYKEFILQLLGNYYVRESGLIRAEELRRMYLLFRELDSDDLKSHHHMACMTEEERSEMEHREQENAALERMKWVEQQKAAICQRFQTDYDGSIESLKDLLEAYIDKRTVDDYNPSALASELAMEIILKKIDTEFHMRQSEAADLLNVLSMLVSSNTIGIMAMKDIISRVEERTEDVAYAEQAESHFDTGTKKNQV